MICPPSHAHAGSTTCPTRHGCACAPCRRAAAAYRHARALGGRRMIDAGVAREHLAFLGRNGMQPVCIARAGGVPPREIYRLLHASPSTRVRAATAVQLLAVAPASARRCDGNHLVPALGTRRRLQALQFCGWSLTAIAAEAGATTAELARATRQRRVAHRIANLVAIVYDRLWDAPPPTSTARERSVEHHVRTYARSHGYRSPLAWDDIDDGPPAPLHGDDEEIVDELALELHGLGEAVQLHRGERRVLRRLRAA